LRVFSRVPAGKLTLVLTPRRLLFVAGLGAFVFAIPFAFAQPKRGAPPARPRPAASATAKPPAAKADAEAPAAQPADAAPPEDASDLPTAHPESWDGGPRPSPLTPLPPEYTGNVEAGAPLDYDRILADIASLRARVAAASQNLYLSRISVGVVTEGSDTKVSRLVVSLDDGVVFTAPPGYRAEEGKAVYDHAVAPGRHAVTVEAERPDAKDESFRSVQRSRFIVDVPKDQLLKVEVRLSDDSTMGADFPGDKSGKYDLRIRLRAKATPVGKAP